MRRYQKYTNSNFPAAGSQRKRKRALENAQQVKKRKIEAKQTRTLDLLNIFAKKNQKVMSEVFRVNEIGEVTILRPVSADEANTDIFKSLHPRSHYNFLLFLYKNGSFSADLYPQVDELLEQMASTIKTFPNYANMTDSDEELQSVSRKDILDA